MAKQGVRVWAVALILSLLAGAWQAAPAAAQQGAATCASGYALWANRRSGDETLDISGSNSAIAGRTRSNADLRISGSNNRFTGAVEYATQFQDGGDQNSYPAPAQVAAQAAPVSYDIAAYRPGGPAAAAAQAAGRYTAVSGDLDVSEPRELSGLYYVAGEAKLSASNITGSFTIVAEGPIDVSGSQIRATPYADGLLLFSNQRDPGASVIKLAGGDMSLRGVIYGPGGTVELSGSSNQIAGVILGDALKLNGSSLRISFDAATCPGGGTAPPPPEEEQRPAEPPARIDIGDDDVARRVEVVGGVTFVSIQITIRNTGGRARDTRLVLEHDDDDDDDDDGGGRRGRFELADVRFAEGAGYVRERDGARVVIGVGQNNVIRGRGPIVVVVTYRLNDGRDDDDDDGGRARGEVTFSARASLQFSDSGGRRSVQLAPVVVVVPVTVVAPAPRPADVPRLPLERIDDRFRGAWESRGGLPVFGLPLTEARARADGTVIQIFERARFELRPGGQVQLGLIAVELGYGRPGGPPRDDDDDDGWYYPATGHAIGAPFRGYWGGRGALVIFGLPITGVYTDDDGLETQCFERACMQLFPALRGTPSEIQLRLLGVELVARGRDDDDD